MAITKKAATKTTKIATAAKGATKMTTVKNTKTTAKPAAKKAPAKVAKPAVKKPAVKKPVVRKVAKKAPAKVVKSVRDWEKTAMAKQIIGGLIVNHLRDEGKQLVTHKDQPLVNKMVGKDLWMPGDNGKLVKYGQIKHAIATISTWPELANYIEVFCSDMYFAAHKIRKIGAKFVYDRNIAFPSKRDTVMIDADAINGKVKPVKAKPTETVEVKKVVTAHELITDAIYAEPAKKLVAVTEVRKLAKEIGLKLTVTDKKFILSDKTGPVIEVTMTVDNKARRLSVQVFRQKNAKTSDGRWVNVKHSLGNSLGFKAMLDPVEKHDAPHRQQLAYIKQYITDDVCEALDDAYGAYRAHQDKINK